MDPLGNILGAMWKVVSAIVKAPRTARRNKARRRELALRAKGVNDVLRRYRKAARGDAASATTRRILGRLKDAVDDAFKLAECCGARRSSDGLLSRLQLHRLVAGDGLDAKLSDVNSRITDCLVDLQAASAVRMMDLHAANSAGMEKKMDELAAGARDPRRTNNA
uniref:Uncharacterized protein n=2 Tax=Oryza brachyantha TaxID=4533 RepID=J3KUL3_ORYBR